MKPRLHNRWIGDAAWIGVMVGLLLLAGCTGAGGSGSPSNQQPSNPGYQGSISSRQSGAGGHEQTQPPSARGAVTETAKPFRFVVMGDSRGNAKGLNEAILRSMMDKVKGLSPAPSFILFTGDQVTGGANVGSQLEAWKDVVDDYFPMTSENTFSLCSWLPSAG